MKVRPSVKPMNEYCRVILREGTVRVICENPKHKQNHLQVGFLIGKSAHLLSCLLALLDALLNIGSWISRHT